MEKLNKFFINFVYRVVDTFNFILFSDWGEGSKRTRNDKRKRLFFTVFTVPRTLGNSKFPLVLLHSGVLQKSLTRVLEKFWVIQPFSTCDNAVKPKLGAHVTEGIPNAHAKFHSNWLKITQ